MDKFVLRTPRVPIPADPNAVLERVFGLKSFRGKQGEIVEAVLKNLDVLVLMPTGGGKSLTYQLPAVMSTGVSLVVSPLLALIVGISLV